MTTKVFVDTNILISAAFWEGAAFTLTERMLLEELEGFTTNEMLEEYAKVLIRDFSLSEKEKDKRIKKALEFLTVVFPKEKIEFVKADPDDDKVLEGAIEADANFIVSYDRHLLDLKIFRNITIIKPEELLRKLGN